MSEEIRRIIDKRDTRSHFERIKHLIQQQGVNIEQVGYCNWTLLTTAASYGDLACVKFLIQNGANIQHGGIDLWTPLHHAAREGHLDVVKYLIQNGAVIDAVNRHDTTPLMLASYKGRVDVVKYLLDMGADHSIADWNDRTALQIAEKENKYRVAELLRQHKMEIGKQRQLELVQRQQQEEKEEEQQHDPLYFDGTFIRSSDELKLVIAHLEKQLDLFWFYDSDMGADMRNKDWFVNRNERLSALVQMDRDGKLPILKDLKDQIDSIKQQVNQYTQDQRAKWLNIRCDTAAPTVGDANDKEVVALVSDYVSHLSRMEKEMSSLCEEHLMAVRSLEQTRIAMSHM